MDDPIVMVGPVRERLGRLMPVFALALSGVAACSVAPGVPGDGVVRLPSGVEVDRPRREVRVAAAVAADRGWLEQVVCEAGTRDHEALLTVKVPASEIHAALLILGARPGTPGSWRREPDGTVARVAPTGDVLEVLVRGAFGERPISSWVLDRTDGTRFPDQPWVFAGSRMLDDEGSRRGKPRYAADRSGSVVGLVTFGDEAIACVDVIADRAEVDAPAWQARQGTVPPPGTAVTLVIRPAAPGRGAGP